jgi:chromosome segregation ATPase
MLLLLYLNHVIFVCLAITIITDAAASGNDIFNSVERDNPDTLKMVLKQMEVMQAKITKLEESEASLKLSLSALMGTQKLCLSQIDALTYQINTLKPEMVEMGNKSKPLKETTEQMDKLQKNWSLNKTCIIRNMELKTVAEQNVKRVGRFF